MNITAHMMKLDLGKQMFDQGTPVRRIEKVTNRDGKGEGEHKRNNNFILFWICFSLRFAYNTILSVLYVLCHTALICSVHFQFHLIVPALSFVKHKHVNLNQISVIIRKKSFGKQTVRVKSDSISIQNQQTSKSF